MPQHALLQPVVSLKTHTSHWRSKTSMPLLHDLTHALPQAIVSHEEHDTVYVKDYACRSFSVATLRAMIEVVLENMPAGRLPSKVQFAVHESLQSPQVPCRTCLRVGSLSQYSLLYMKPRNYPQSPHRMPAVLSRYQLQDTFRL